LRDPLHDLRQALNSIVDPPPHLMHLDLDRQQRTGVPEIVMVEGKDPASVLAIVREMLDHSGCAILSRTRPRILRMLSEAFSDMRVDEYPRARMVVVRRPDYRPQPTGGRVGVLTAGTSDAPYAEQAQVVAQQMGCEVTTLYDVGVAGLHRIVPAMRRLYADRVDVVVVAAGMDGALPSVVAGLVDIPVIGLPTSTGYGAGGKGEAALLSMLQTCAPGLSVVNIDNGVGAGACAARIANGVAAIRQALDAAPVRTPEAV
jgi:pyridinium-3,5-biscarboxylic acid mononucleotide synthase